MIPILLQVERAANDDDLKIVFAIDEAASFLLETGFKKPISLLGMKDKALHASLVDFHCLIKAKAAVHQFSEGLASLNVLGMLQQYPEVMKPLFMYEEHALTSGVYIFMP